MELLQDMLTIVVLFIVYARGIKYDLNRKKVFIDERISGLMLGQEQSSTGVLENSISEKLERFRGKKTCWSLLLKQHR